ncbi:MAG: CHASE2 domain-containing protein, partial [Alphaproteobacteria bacterium]|nr:CHASE2 domain-containing protein [Alphaproteobacteria bacterium]
MNRRLLSLVPYLILFLGLVVRVQDPLPIEQVRWLIFDTYQRIKPRPYDPNLPVKIVDIDEESLARLGQWPWPRHTTADLVRRLGRMGATVIALDIVFAEPDRTSPERILPLWPPLPEVEALRKRAYALPSHDGMLSEAISQARVVTGFILTREPGGDLPMVKGTVAYAGDDPRPFLVSYGGAAINLPEIEIVAEGNGSLVGTPDRDQVFRRIPLVVRIGDQMYPSLTTEALRVAQGAKSILIKSSGASGETAFGKQTGINNIRIGKMVVPTDANGRLFVHYSPRTADRYISAWEVLEPDFDPERVGGKIILIGVSAAGLHDIRATPLNPITPGVEIHAQVIEHIMTGKFLQRPDFATGAELVYMLVLGLALILLLPRIGAIWSTLLGSLTTVVAVGGSWYAFDTLGWLVDPVVPSIVAGMVFLSETLLVYLRSESERRQVRDAFAHYLSPVLVEQLAKNPDQLKLGGEIKQMSILFSD